MPAALPHFCSWPAQGMRGKANDWNRIYLPACVATLPWHKAPVRRSAWLLMVIGGGFSLFALTALTMVSGEPSSVFFSGDAEPQAVAARSSNALHRTASHPVPRTAVFKWLSSQITGRPQQWQKVLDVGSGLNSLSWLVNSTCADITAVVSSEQSATELRSAIQQGRFERPVSCTNVEGTRVKVQVGDWADPAFLRGGDWDAILADQLLGDVRLQSQWPAVARLASSVRHGGGMLLFVGQEIAEGEVERTRRAMLLLAGRTSDYQECPQALVAWELNRSGLVIEASSRFPDTNPMARNAAAAARMAAQEASASKMLPGVTKAIARLADEMSRAENASKARNGVAGWKYAIAARRP